MKIHIVQKGDTLWNLSKKYNVDFEQLKALNTHLTNPDMLMPGMKIKIPTEGVPVKKESVKETPVKKEMPKKEVQKEIPAPPAVDVPKVETPQPTWQPTVQVQQMPYLNQEYEMNMNFNIYKPQPMMQKPAKQHVIPQIPKPPTPPKIEKPKKPAEMKQPEQPKAPISQQIPQQIPPQMPQQPIMHQWPCYNPCAPYYPISPVLPGCADPCDMPYSMQPISGIDLSSQANNQQMLENEQTMLMQQPASQPIWTQQTTSQLVPDQTMWSQQTASQAMWSQPPVSQMFPSQMMWSQPPASQVMPSQMMWSQPPASQVMPSQMMWSQPPTNQPVSGQWMQPATSQMMPGQMMWSQPPAGQMMPNQAMQQPANQSIWMQRMPNQPLENNYEYDDLDD